MRILSESELYRLARKDVEAAKEKLQEVDFVFDRGGWLVPPEYYLDKLKEAKA